MKKHLGWFGIFCLLVLAIISCSLSRIGEAGTAIPIEQLSTIRAGVCYEYRDCEDTTTPTIPSHKCKTTAPCTTNDECEDLVLVAATVCNDDRIARYCTDTDYLDWADCSDFKTNCFPKRQVGPLCIGNLCSMLHGNSTTCGTTVWDCVN